MRQGGEGGGGSGGERRRSGGGGGGGRRRAGVGDGRASLGVLGKGKCNGPSRVNGASLCAPYCSKDARPIYPLLLGIAIRIRWVGRVDI